MKYEAIGIFIMSAAWAAGAAGQTPAPGSSAPGAPTSRPVAIPPGPHNSARIPAKPSGPVKPAPNVPTPTITLKPGEVPGIRFDTPTYDFGRIRSGSDVEHDYWFTNTGNGPLEILAVRPG